MVAMKEAVKSAGENAEIRIESDSKYVINAVTKDRQKREDQGYIGVANRDLERVTVAELRKRKTETRIKWVKGHNGHTRNEGADRKADEGARKDEGDEIEIAVPPTLRVTGAKLSAMTQSLAYRAIRERKLKKRKKRNRTVANLERAKAEAEDNFGFIPTEEKIWRSFQNKDLSKQIQYFMWMITHDAYYVRTHWLREGTSPEMQERGICKHCDIPETMEHILSQCEAPGQGKVWELAKELWLKRNPDWAWPGIGTIIMAGLASFKNEEGNVKVGDARLYRILMSELAYLIWKLWCERVIQNEGRHATDTEIHNRWVTTMNARLSLDCSMTDRKFEKKAIPVKKVLTTWKNILKDEARLPDDWTGSAGVLVGIEPRRQQEEG
ncbi:hypothetical protein B0H14DRAFT_2410354 [Mycena olivaceomarginata]|nr:hypothetical protein B0H14DRAFT_2410354 [Mycena olivaceomarginata]